jgi:hypothetical protein
MMSLRENNYEQSRENGKRRNYLNRGLRDNLEHKEPLFLFFQPEQSSGVLNRIAPLNKSAQQGKSI